MRKMLPFILCLICYCSNAQQKPTDLDKSPLDMSYSPQNYPILKMNGKTTEQPASRVIYSRPQKSGRTIFGGIISYNQVWRLGANESTEIEFFRNVKINNKPVPKGRYSLYAICNPEKWTLILNNDKDIWGLAYNQKKDVLRVEENVQNAGTQNEFFTMYFEDKKGGTNLNILWDSVKVVMPISFQ